MKKILKLFLKKRTEHADEQLLDGAGNPEGTLYDPEGNVTEDAEIGVPFDIWILNNTDEGQDVYAEAPDAGDEDDYSGGGASGGGGGGGASGGGSGYIPPATPYVPIFPFTPIKVPVKIPVVLKGLTTSPKFTVSPKVYTAILPKPGGTTLATERPTGNVTPSVIRVANKISTASVSTAKKR